MRPEINPAPTPEEAAAIVAALELLRGGAPPGEAPLSRWPVRSRWEVAGRLGRPLPPEMELEGALWPVVNRGRSV